MRIPSGRHAGIPPSRPVIPETKILITIHSDKGHETQGSSQHTSSLYIPGITQNCWDRGAMHFLFMFSNKAVSK